MREAGAVVHRGPHDGQAQGDVDGPAEGHQLDRHDALIVLASCPGRGRPRLEPLPRLRLPGSAAGQLCQPRSAAAPRRRRWNAPADVSELIASGGAALARYQPSQRYFLLDEGRVGDADLPGGNLVSALIALETSRDRERLPALLGSLIGLLREQGDEADPGRLAEIGDWIIECGTAADLLARVSDERRRGV